MSAIGAIDARQSEELRSRYGGGGGYNWDFLGHGGGSLPKGPAALGDSLAPGMCDPLGASSVNFDSWGMDGMMAEGETKPKGGRKTKGRSRTGRTTRARRSRRGRRGSRARRGARARRGQRTRRTRRAA